MSRQSAELDDALQAELVRRVMALEGREETLRLNNAHMETTVDALAECTDVSRANITAIADELARNSASGSIERSSLSDGDVSRGFSHRRVALGAAVLVAGLAIFAMRPSTPSPFAGHEASMNFEPDASAVAADNPFVLRAHLGGAMADTTSLRMMIAEQYMVMGKYPDSFEQFGVDPATLISRNVKRVALEPEGRLVAWLPAQFGDDKWIRLTPDLVMGGMQMQWGCEANLSSRILVGIQCDSVRR